MKLYHHPLSGHAHRARLFTALLGLDVELVEVDLAAGEHKSEAFLKINPAGQVPVLDDNGTIVTDSNAIMVYLAKKLGHSNWLPEDPLKAAAVQRWLSIAAGPIAFGPAAARLITVFKAPFNAEEVIARAHQILTQIEADLDDQEWLVGGGPTIADVALYSYIARAPEGNVDLSIYPRIDAWLKRVEMLPGFVEFQQTPVGLSAAA